MKRLPILFIICLLVVVFLGYVVRPTVTINTNEDKLVTEVKVHTIYSIPSYSSGECYLYNGRTLVTQDDSIVVDKLSGDKSGWTHYYVATMSPTEGVAAFVYVCINLPTFNFTEDVRYVELMLDNTIHRVSMVKTDNFASGDTDFYAVAEYEDPSAVVYAVSIDLYSNLHLQFNISKGGFDIINLRILDSNNGIIVGA